MIYRHSRGYLPHISGAALTTHLVFRLRDSVPRQLLRLWHEELSKHSEYNQRLFARIESYLDTGEGANLLADPRAARIVERELARGDGVDYELLAWVVMPNHVHALIRLLNQVRITRLCGAWKSRSAVEIRRELGGRGPIWQPGVFDRYIRSDEHLTNTVEYIHRNPVRAGLVLRPEDFEFSSARSWTTH